MTFIPRIKRFTTLPSTNSELARLALLGAAEGLCVVADEQTEGRGRLQREWVSPRNAGLYFSILLRPTISVEMWPLLTLMAAIAVHDTLREVFDIELDIKWPNDLLSGERKLCGILAEAIETEDGRVVVLGIGINLTSTGFPPALTPAAISVADATGAIVDREVILETLIRNISHYYALLSTERGNSQIIKKWMDRSSYAHDKLVRISMASETVEGLTRGLEADGALRVETNKGEMRIIRAGDITALRSRH